MILYGIRPVEELIATVADRAIRAIAADWGGRLKPLAAKLDEAGVRRERTTRAELDALCEGGNHQGVAVELLPFAYASLESIIASQADSPRALILALDRVQDVGNLGAILRTAAALGVAGVLVPKHRAASVTGAVVRSSAGQALRVPVAQVTNLKRALDELKAHGWWAVGAGSGEAAQQVAPHAIDWDMRAVIVMGSEHDGIRRLVDEACDLHAAIPMTRGVESLNVSCACAVLCYEATRGVFDGGGEGSDA